MRVAIVVIGIYFTFLAFILTRVCKRNIDQSKVLPQRSVTTSTRHYSFSESEESGTDVYVPCAANCSWEQHLSNADFKAQINYTAPFQIDDDQNVLKLKRSLACVPFTFGYSVSRGNEVFPPHPYPSCTSYLTEWAPELDLNPEERRLTMFCPAEHTGKYVLQPTTVPTTQFNTYFHMVNKLTPDLYPGEPVQDLESEFVLGSCGQEFTEARLIPRFNASVYARAKEIMRKESNSTAVHPMIILFLTIDSFSRRHFFRKMNKTVEFLNSLNAEGKYTVFDFKLHNIMGRISPENMVPMFSNRTLKMYPQPIDNDALGSSSLWALLKDSGYVTTLGFESCGSDFLNFIGRNLQVDHFVNSFYCAAKKFVNVRKGADGVEQRCVGPRMSHEYILNYTKGLTRKYQGVNQFMYFHIDTAHEQSGLHAALLDPDLPLFLQDYLSSFGEQNDVAIFIQADHGMRYGNWLVDLEAEQEMKLPVMMFLTQTKLLDRLPNSFDALWHNTVRLVSKRDFRATILALSKLPYGIAYPVHEERYLEEAVVLFQEKVKDSRTCESASIAPWNCGCLNAPERVPQEILYSWGHHPLGNLLVEIVNTALDMVNQEVFTPANLPSNFLCQKLHFDYIIRAYGYHLSNTTEQIRIEFAVQESVSVRFESLVIVGSDRNDAVMQSLAELLIEPTTYQGYKTMYKVRDMVGHVHVQKGQVRG